MNCDDFAYSPFGIRCFFFYTWIIRTRKEKKSVNAWCADSIDYVIKGGRMWAWAAAHGNKVKIISNIHNNHSMNCIDYFPIICDLFLYLLPHSTDFVVPRLANYLKISRKTELRIEVDWIQLFN